MCFRHKAAGAVTVAPTCAGPGTVTTITSGQNDTTQCTQRNNLVLVWTDSSQNNLRWIHCMHAGDTASTASDNMVLSS
jgi:hypothetical protein